MHRTRSTTQPRSETGSLIRTAAGAGDQLQDGRIGRRSLVTLARGASRSSRARPSVPAAQWPVRPAPACSGHAAAGAGHVARPRGPVGSSRVGRAASAEPRRPSRVGRAASAERGPDLAYTARDGLHVGHLPARHGAFRDRRDRRDGVSTAIGRTASRSMRSARSASSRRSSWSRSTAAATCPAVRAAGRYAVNVLGDGHAAPLGLLRRCRGRTRPRRLLRRDLATGRDRPAAHRWRHRHARMHDRPDRLGR